MIPNGIHRTALCTLCLLFTTSFMAHAEPGAPTTLKNDPARCEAFMNWGVGMFIHWSLDSELGSVISHSMVGAVRRLS